MLVSQSTFRILQRLYDVRLRMFQVVVVSLAVALIFTVVGSLTIVRPLRQLRDDAEALVDHHGRRLRAFRGTARRDEIGELARALEELTRRLDAHLRFTERFAADVSHELRNPLASIRASAETLAVAERTEDRARFHARIATDIARLETLIAGVREVTRVDAGLEAEERRPIDLAALVRERAGDGAGVTLTVTGEAPIVVDASADRLGQVLDNLLDNARSFSPPGERDRGGGGAGRRVGPGSRPRSRPRHPGRARRAHLRPLLQPSSGPGRRAPEARRPGPVDRPGHRRAARRCAHRRHPPRRRRRLRADAAAGLAAPDAAPELLPELLPMVWSTCRKRGRNCYAPASRSVSRKARIVPFHESVLSNCSSSACAPDPLPPASMVIAGMPRYIAALASVESSLSDRRAPIAAVALRAARTIVVVSAVAAGRPIADHRQRRA